jgi:hypothetical protein
MSSLEGPQMQIQITCIFIQIPCIFGSWEIKQKKEIRKLKRKMGKIEKPCVFEPHEGII